MRFSRRLAAFVLALAQIAHGAGVVGSGTSASCTEAALLDALADGGLVTFDCGVAPAPIVMNALYIVSADTTIDGGGTITLTGTDTTPLFVVTSDVTLTLAGLTLSDGYSGGSDGGAIESLGALVVDSCTFSDNGLPPATVVVPS